MLPCNTSAAYMDDGIKGCICYGTKNEIYTLVFMIRIFHQLFEYPLRKQYKIMIQSNQSAERN